MTDNSRITARECAEALLALDKITVIMHQHPDADTVGSGAALTLILKALGKDASFSSPDKIPARLGFLTDGVAMEESLEGRTLVAIDVASKNQLGAFKDELYALMIDHHSMGEAFAPCYKIDDASSAAEVLLHITDELSNMGKFEMTKDIAMRIYAAMSSDTGGFIYSSATPETYRRAAQLMETGIDYADINHKLFNSKPKSQIKAEGFISSNIKTAYGGKVAYATLSQKELLSLGLRLEDFDTAVDVVRSLLGAEVVFFLREVEPGKYKASLRSTGANVASVAARLNGGGHVRAAGCAPDAKSIDGAAVLMLMEIGKLFINGEVLLNE